MTRRKVKGPNGLVFDLPTLTATGLVGKGNRGYEYVEDEPQSTEPTANWKVDDLRAYAAENGIDLGEAKKKADILAAITASPSGEEGGSSESSDEQE